jgi:hypothetical protein
VGILVVNEIIINSKEDLSITLTNYEVGLLNFIESFGLPTESVLVGVDERKRVFRNIEDALNLLNSNIKSNAIYISKFLAATSAGLFDSALNYLWDETISQLRYRVAQYDIEYFYDLAVKGDKRKRLKGIEDLSKLDDSELIEGAKEIDLVSNIGYRHLDHIKYMRNWASAAHPNQSEITGLQLISWLETCIKEVISLPASNVTIEIGKLLNNIKSKEISLKDADNISSFFARLSPEKANALGSGLFGIYTRLDTNEISKTNINRLLPILWEQLDESTKDGFGLKFARFTANGDVEEARLCRAFLNIVSGEQYLPEDIRITEINNALDNLFNAHISIGNFYTEPSYARQLKRLIGDHAIPKQIDSKYVNTLVDVFLTNGNGVCWDSEGIFVELIKTFTERQVILAVMAFQSDRISSKLQFSLCNNKYDHLLMLLEPKITIPAVNEMVMAIKNYGKENRDSMRDDSKINKIVSVLKRLLK